MSNKQTVIWVARPPEDVKNKNTPSALANLAVQITEKDKKQIIAGFKSQSYEMTCTYLWDKTIHSLKRQIEKLGVQFVAEMLNRDDISEDSKIESILTDFEAIRLSEDLGMITSTGALRLRQAQEMVSHFNRLDGIEGESEEMSKLEAFNILQSCVQNVLAKDRIEVALNFQKFRDDLVTMVFQEDDERVHLLINSPYFHQRTAIRVLMAIAKASIGAKLENSLANINTLLPLLWDKIQEPERWQIGKTYADVIADGKKTACSGLKTALLKVKGFDYVPEDLRSKSFMKAANDVLTVHDSFNNFYNEPGPMSILAGMGTSIPAPAFFITMQATLSVVLGNGYGRASGAQESATRILKTLNKDRWKYFLDSCLPFDDRLVGKLMKSNCLRIWKVVIEDFDLDKLVLKRSDVSKLVALTMAGKLSEAENAAATLYEKIGYSTKK